MREHYLFASLLSGDVSNTTTIKLGTYIAGRQSCIKFVLKNG